MKKKRAKGEARRVDFIPPGNNGDILAIPAGRPDVQALDAVCREWLVPQLIDKFLRERNVVLQHRKDHMRSTFSTSGPLGKECGK